MGDEFIEDGMVDESRRSEVEAYSATCDVVNEEDYPDHQVLGLEFRPSWKPTGEMIGGEDHTVELEIEIEKR